MKLFIKDNIKLDKSKTLKLELALRCSCSFHLSHAVHQDIHLFVDHD